MWPVVLPILLRLEEAEAWSDAVTGLRCCPLVDGHLVVAAFYIGLARSVLDRNIPGIREWLDLAGKVRLQAHDLTMSAEDPDGAVRRAILGLQSRTRSEAVVKLSSSYVAWVKMIETVLDSKKYQGRTLSDQLDLLKDEDSINYVDGRPMNRCLLLAAKSAIASFRETATVDVFLLLERRWGRTLFSLQSESWSACMLWKCFTMHCLLYIPGPNTEEYSVPRRNCDFC